MVVDPMAGSGTTIDVANELNRKVIGYDLNAVRPDVIKNNSRKIPLKDNSVDFVFIDSPYSDNIKYSNEPACIGKISCEKKEFYDELEKVASEIARILKPGKVMGWVIADQWIKKKFTPTGFLMWYQRARQYNFYLRGFKYLFIMRKPLFSCHN